MTKGIHRAWLVFIGCCVISFMVLGLGNGTNGLFFPYLAASLNVSYTQILTGNMVTTLTMTVFLPIGARLIDKIDVRILATACAIFESAGYILRSVSNSLTEYYIASVVLGMGSSALSGLLGSVLLTTWFRKKLGTVLGVMMAIGGFGGAIANPIVGQLIALLGWRKAQLAIGVLVAAIIVPVSVVLLRRRPGTNEHAYGESGPANGGQPGPLRGPAFKEILHNGVFYVFVAGMVFLVASGVFQSHLATLTLNKGFTLAFAATVTSTYMVGNGLGRLCMGIMLDSFGPKKTMATFSLFGAAGYIVLALISNRPLLMLGAFLAGVYTSILMVAPPFLLSGTFGEKAYAQMSSVSGMLSTLSAAFVAVLVGMSYDANGNYTYILLLFAVFTLIGPALLLLAYSKRHSAFLAKSDTSLL